VARSSRSCQAPVPYLQGERYVVARFRFYPLFPAPSGAQIDLGQSHTTHLPITPDIVILPSDLKAFVKVRGVWERRSLPHGS